MTFFFNHTHILIIEYFIHALKMSLVALLVSLGGLTA
jgi:hypothetical protein